MAKKKTKNTRRQMRAKASAVHTAHENPRVVYLLNYEITEEPMPDPRYPHLPEEVVERLHDLVMTQSKAAIPELIEQIEHHPDVPMLYNYLAAAYGYTRDISKYEHVVLENFQRFPEYLFARLNYAELLLRKRDYDRVADLLNHAFDIGLFYPERKCFHITEYTGFTGTVGLYHIGVGNLEAAEKVLDMLEQVAPEEPITRRLQSELLARRLELGLAALKRRQRSSASPSR